MKTLPTNPEGKGRESTRLVFICQHSCIGYISITHEVDKLIENVTDSAISGRLAVWLQKDCVD